eukprot:Gregarina_sp_Poly_1__7935@NODE_452_length_8287_cov_521_171290_g369_i0_p7_GENE_NODE_452_length_8287_cov_521_171290_g369_i0NODE_452_length_8287_cov_521_171290_g369_i0_p7_ORF_typecomplete_len183_score25_67NuA4/PF09340_10/4_1e05_NODE_452_length_8287_cov_521_171290_g369_i065927140
MTVSNVPAEDIPDLRQRRSVKTSHSAPTKRTFQAKSEPRQSNNVLDDMKFASLDLRRRLKIQEKRISSMECSYLQKSLCIDGQLCNVLNGFSNNICLKSSPPETADAETRLQNIRKRHLALTRSVLTGSINVDPLSWNEETERVLLASADPDSSIQLHQCLFSLTSLSSPALSTLVQSWRSC